MKIGIFGGTFNPIHLGHVNAIGEAKVHFKLDKIIVIPNAQSPHKEERPIADYHRVNMIKSAVDLFDFVEINDLELEREGFSYTFDTLTELKTKYPNDELYFIIGEDQYLSFNKWYKSKELLYLFTFIVLRRSTSNIQVLPPFLSKDTNIFEVSSSEIRNRAQKEILFSHLVNEKVHEYIKEHRLYETQ